MSQNTGRNFFQGPIPEFSASETINDDDVPDEEWPPTASPIATSSAPTPDIPSSNNPTPDVPTPVIPTPDVPTPGCRFGTLKGMLLTLSNRLAVKNELTYRLVSLSLCK